MTRAIVFGVLVATTLAACAPTTAPDDAGIGTVTVASPSAATAVPTPSGTVVATTQVPTTQVVADEGVPVGPLFLEDATLSTVRLRTPTAGAGSRPLLQWDPVSGVHRYMVFVFDPDGDAYWSWSTADTSVAVGGLESGGSSTPGPRIWTDLTWTVIGVDANGAPIAQGELRPIAP